MNNFIKMPKKRGLCWILVFRGDYPFQAQELNLHKPSDREYLEDLIEFVRRDSKGWGIAQFRDYKCYQKGCRLIGQHWQLKRDGATDPLVYYKGGILIGKFQKLVKQLGYEREPLSESQKTAIREEHKFSGYRVTKLAEDWDVSESHIRTILKGDNTPVYPSKPSTKIGTSDVEPPGPGRVVLRCHGGSR